MRTALVLAIVLAACTPSSSPPPSSGAPSDGAAPRPLSDGTDVPEATLRDAVEDKVGVPDMGPAEILASWTWRPRAATTYVVWVTCRGAGDSRACAISVATPGAAHVDIKAHAAAGWSPPKLSIDGAPHKLRVAGDDGQGAWTQSLEAKEDGSVVLGERTHS